MYRVNASRASSLVTYEGFAAAWPERDDEAGFAKKMNEMQKYVVSTTLVRTLLENDLVDELRLMVFPVLLGQGKRLFPEGEETRPLKLIEAQTVGDGVSILRYERGSND